MQLRCLSSSRVQLLRQFLPTVRNARVSSKNGVTDRRFAGTDAYMRVNHQPHITIIDFFDFLKFDDAVANVHDGILTVTLPKQNVGTWQKLSAEGSRTELNARRLAADERKAEFEEKVCNALHCFAKRSPELAAYAETQASGR